MEELDLINQEETEEEYTNYKNSTVTIADVASVSVINPTPMKFKFVHDLALLQQTMHLNPFCSSKTKSQVRCCWRQIATDLRTSSSLSMKVTARSCKKRVELLGKKLLPSSSALSADELPLLIQLRQDKSNWNKFPTETLTTTTMEPPSSSSSLQANYQTLLTSSSDPPHQHLFEKLAGLECRVVEIEKHLTIIFDLITPRQESGTGGRASGKAPSEQVIILRSRPNTNFKASHQHHQRHAQIKRATTITSNQKHIENLNLNPIVKIQKLPSSSAAGTPPPSVDVSDIKSGNNTTSIFPVDNFELVPSIKIEQTIYEGDDHDKVGAGTDPDFTQPDSYVATTSDSDSDSPHQPERPIVPPAAAAQGQTQAHQRIHNRKVRIRGHFTCPQCPKVLRSAKTLQFHMQWHRDNPTPGRVPLRGHFPCPQCKQVVSSNKILHRHIKLAHDSPRPMANYPCPQCSKSISTKSSLAQHIREIHGDETGVIPHPFICPTCGKPFKRAEYLCQHEETHSEVRKYKCPYCDSRFRQKKGLIGHTRFHLISLKGKAQCTTCGQLFVSQHNLNLHVKRIHEGLRAYPCPMPNCDKRFKSSTHLKYHVGTHSNPNGRKRGLNVDHGGEVRVKKIIGGVTAIKQITSTGIMEEEEEEEAGTSSRSKEPTTINAAKDPSSQI